MVRTIVSRPDFSGTPLGELKQFLAITVPRDDALLEQLLHTAHALCESFTGLTPMTTAIEQTVPARCGWHRLTVAPVIDVANAQWIDDQGVRTPIAADDFESRIEADGTACVRIKRSVGHNRAAFTVTAQISDSWQTLPADLRHGLIRLAAHAYRERDTGPVTQPPASVAALWRPHRKLRL